MNLKYRNRIAALVLFCVSICVSIGCDRGPQAANPPGNETDLLTVELEIDFNDRAENKTLSAECAAGSTVFSLLRQLVEDGTIELESSGDRETAFVIGIDGVENEGASGDNWVYFVDKVLGDRGCGVFELESGNRILWRFGKYEPDADTGS